MSRSDRRIIFNSRGKQYDRACLRFYVRKEKRSWICFSSRGVCIGRNSYRQERKIFPSLPRSRFELPVRRSTSMWKILQREIRHEIPKAESFQPARWRTASTSSSSCFGILLGNYGMLFM